MIILLFSQLFNQSLANFHYNFSGDFSTPVKKKTSSHALSYFH